MKDNTAAVNAQVPVDVATFLLNEKRVDLQLVEARHRVSVTLIPNMHLETPNYTVTRLRHDDLNQSDQLPPSYEMVETPAEQETPAVSPQEAAPPKQQAAVRGITPQQPAPVSREQASAVPASALSQDASIISKIFGWFRRQPVEPAAPQRVSATPAVAPQRAHREPSRSRDSGGSRDSGRRDRHSQGGRQRDAQAPSGNRRDRDAARQRPEADHKQQRRPDNGQRQRTQHAEPQSEQAGPAQQETTQQQTVRAPGEGRGRRRRGRRDRHEQKDEAAIAQRAAPPLPDVADGASDAIMAGRTGPVFAPTLPESVPPVAETAALETADNALSALDPAVRPEPVPAPAATSISVEPAPAMAAEMPAAEPPHEAEVVREEVPAVALVAPEVPPATKALLKFDWSTDLIQIETHPEKLAATVASMQAEIVPPRQKRQRAPLPPLSNEPLIQVETRHRQDGAGPIPVIAVASSAAVPGVAAQEHA